MGVNLSKTVEQMRRFGGDLQDIEVKEAVGGMPKSMGDSVSALANGSGGLVILGLSEKLGFMPAP
ncbi:helix-turn-helix domain-containing protein, partial [Parolsenella catena]